MSRQDNKIWSNPPQASLSLGSSGPQRVDTSTPDPDFVPRPAGFAANLAPPEAEPQVWEGDGA